MYDMKNLPKNSSGPITANFEIIVTEKENLNTINLHDMYVHVTQFIFQCHRFPFT